MKEVSFKANDIRGLYPKEINEPLFYHIGQILPQILKTKKVAIGRDIRLSSNSLFSMLCEGINHSGCDVLDLGLCDTPYTYFISGKYKIPCLMITASHNPKEYNGLKIINSDAVPINDKQISLLVKKLQNIKHIETKKEGKIIHFNKKNEYINFVLSKVNKKELSNIKIVVDCSNGMASFVMKEIFSHTPAEIVYINEHMDGLFPAHVPNPAMKENLKQLQEKVIKEKADLGIIFDGDCDRVAFVDEKGEIIDSSISASIFAHYFLNNKPSAIVHTETASLVLKDTIEMYGGLPIAARVGHRFIKESMIKKRAIFGAEPSGHYYFGMNYYADSGLIGALLFYNIISQIKSPVSLLRKTFDKYFSLGEINYKVKNREISFKKLKSFIKSTKPNIESNLDGYSAVKINTNGKTMHVTIRKSNTENYIRVTIESDCIKCAKQFKREVDNILK